MASSENAQGGSGSGTNASAATSGAGPSSEVAPDRLGSARAPVKTSDERVQTPATEPPGVAPEARGEPGKPRRAESNAPPPKDAERREPNGVERPDPAEVSRAETLSVDARIAADIARLAKIRARDRAEAERVLNQTRTQPAEPLEGVGDRPRRQDRAPPEPVRAGKPEGPIVPREVADEFVQVGVKFYHRDDPKRVAFEYTGAGFETSLNTPRVARAFAALSEVNWDEGVKVRGSAEFRREVFIEASARGVRVIGYRPRDEDLAEIEVRVAQLAGRNAVEPAAARAQDFRRLAPEEALKRPDLASAAAAAEAVSRLGDAVRDPRLRERLQGGFREQLAAGMERGDTPRPLDDARVGARISVPEGVYMESGHARYKFDPQERENFYVRYRRADGEVRETWGKELESAIKDARVQPGDTIRLQREGAKPVKVVGNVRDADNRVIGQQEIDTHRNAWKVEVVARQQERASPAPPERSRGR